MLLMNGVLSLFFKLVSLLFKLKKENSGKRKRCEEESKKEENENEEVSIQCIVYRGGEVGGWDAVEEDKVVDKDIRRDTSECLNNKH